MRISKKCDPDWFSRFDKMEKYKKDKIKLNKRLNIFKNELPWENLTKSLIRQKKAILDKKKPN